ncbi:MAG TPA: DUF5667 domain-containing protein [Ktedonobacterales bacterium]|nr:DUF5667 domain-containing protein [Ktedonobacterales bacterium]
MQTEDRLDTLLSARLHNTSQLPDTWVAVDDELLPLLQAADALRPFRSAQPSAEFAAAMEGRLLALNASLMKQLDEPAAVDEANRSPAAPNIYSLPAPTERDTLRHRRQQRTHRYPQWRAWHMIAAAILLCVAGVSVLTAAAASAGPDSPLYGLHRVEQNVRVQLASSQGDRVRLHLSYANEALAQLDAAVAQHAGDPAYSSALATFSSEQLAAAQGVAALSAGTERATLDAQLATLRLKARTDLHAALHAVSWSDRVATTQVLGALGEPILVVRVVTVTRQDGPNIHLLRLVASGSGFAPGAVITVDGQAAGTLIAVSATQLVVEIDATTFHLPLRDIGVSNPDGTAALSLMVEIDNGSDHSSGPPSHPTPVAHPTPTPNGGHRHGNSGGS